MTARLVLPSLAPPAPASFEQPTRHPYPEYGLGDALSPRDCVDDLDRLPIQPADDNTVGEDLGDAGQLDDLRFDDFRQPANSGAHDATPFRSEEAYARSMRHGVPAQGFAPDWCPKGLTADGEA